MGVEPEFVHPLDSPILGLSTDGNVWAEHFLREFPETGLSELEVAAWFDKAMETAGTMRVASLPLPPGLFGARR